MWLLFLEPWLHTRPRKPKFCPWSCLGSCEKKERILDHPKANSIAFCVFKCAWKSQFSVMGQEVPLIGVFGCFFPRTVMKGKEEVDRLLCRFEERFRWCLLFTQAIPVSFAGRCYLLHVDNSASAREYFWRLTGDVKLSLLVATSSMYSNDIDGVRSTGCNNHSLA